MARGAQRAGAANRDASAFSTLAYRAVCRARGYGDAETAHCRAQEVCQALRVGRLSVGVAGSAERHHKQLDIAAQSSSVRSSILERAG